VTRPWGTLTAWQKYKRIMFWLSLAVYLGSSLYLAVYGYYSADGFGEILAMAAFGPLGMVGVFVAVFLGVPWMLRDSAEVQAGRPYPGGRRIPVPQDVRWTVFMRDGYRCVACGSPLDLTIDHIHPVAWGGTNDPSNLRTLCRSCNSVKGDMW